MGIGVFSVPEITTRELDISCDAFLCLGSDGVFEFVTNQVGEHLNSSRLLSTVKPQHGRNWLFPISGGGRGQTGTTPSTARAVEIHAHQTPRRPSNETGGVRIIEMRGAQGTPTTDQKAARVATVE